MELEAESSSCMDFADAQTILPLIDTDEQALAFVDSVTQDVGALQSRVLEHILSSNTGVEYFRRHGLSGTPTAEEFHTLLPLVSYNDIQPDVQEILQGRGDGLLCSRPVREVLKSSGTSSGQQKLFPKLPDYDPEFLVLNRVARAALNRQGPYGSGKSLHFIYVRKPHVNPDSGVIQSSGLSGYFTSSAFRNRKIDPAIGYTSPDKVIRCFDYTQACYCHLLCGLAQRSLVVSVGSVFASTLVRSLNALKIHWRDLCQDIRTGRVNTRLVTEQAVGDAVSGILKPDPALAELLMHECRRSDWRGIIRRLWPNAEVVQAIVTGTMKQYVPMINMLSDNLPIASSLYASSECSTLGVNLEPICHPSQVLYTLFPCFAYFEFLPLKARSRSEELGGVEEEEEGEEEAGESVLTSRSLVKLASVKAGKEYELVITTKAGLYRYRVGDVLKVVKFHNSAPQFSFVRRAGVLLSVDTDKTDEAELHNAVTKASDTLLRSYPDVRLVDYTSRVDLSTQPGHYVIYLELSSYAQLLRRLDARLEAELVASCITFEESLDVVYRRNRAEGSVGPAELVLVQTGTFDKIMDYAVISGQTSFAQYKPPRRVSNLDVLTILEGGVLARGNAEKRSML